MTVKELNRDQIDELKERIVTEELDLTGSTPSYMELICSHEIPDKAVYDIFDGVDFTEDDFFTGRN